MWTSSTLSRLGSALKMMGWLMRSLLEKRSHEERRFLKAGHLFPFLISCFHLLRVKAITDLVYLVGAGIMCGVCTLEGHVSKEHR